MNMIIKYTIMSSSAYFKSLDDCFMFQATKMFGLKRHNTCNYNSGGRYDTK